MKNEPKKTRDVVIKKYGWFIVIISLVLYAIQRYIIFSILTNMESQGNEIAYYLIQFLFGESPYAITDLLFGFDYFFNSGFLGPSIFSLCSPSILIPLLIQAIHFGLNYLLIFSIFWVYYKIKSR